MARTFLVLGQSRTGTTLLQSLLNAHPRVHCRGELFDSWQIDDNGRKISEIADTRRRDADPEAFLADYLCEAEAARFKADWFGAKVLFQHNPRLFQEVIPAHPDWHLILVQRPNRLAQFASTQQVGKTGRWTQTGPNASPPPQIAPDPRWVAAECNRFENTGWLLRHWFAGLANPTCTVTYPDLARGRAAPDILRFLGLDAATPLSTALHRQGQPLIRDRFSNADEIAEHFNALGHADWLDDELSP